MDRDEALAEALRIASVTGAIQCIGKDCTENIWWHWSYRAPSVGSDIDTTTIRWVLPNGEVTKLS